MLPAVAKAGRDFVVAASYTPPAAALLCASKGTLAQPARSSGNSRKLRVEFNQ